MTMAEMAEVLSDSRLSFAGIPCCGGPEWKVDYIHRCHIPFQRFTVYVPCSEASCQSTFDKRPLGSYNAATVRQYRFFSVICWKEWSLMKGNLFKCRQMLEKDCYYWHRQSFVWENKLLTWRLTSLQINTVEAASKETQALLIYINPNNYSPGIRQIGENWGKGEWES